VVNEERDVLAQGGDGGEAAGGVLEVGVQAAAAHFVVAADEVLGVVDGFVVHGACGIVY
jgi:hypothetical protein